MPLAMDSTAFFSAAFAAKSTKLLLSLPILVAVPPATDDILPKILKAGPADAAINAHLTIFCCCSLSSELNFLAISPRNSITGLDACTPSRNASTSGPPNSIATSVTSFLSILSLDSVVSYRLFASVVSAEFSSHA